MDINSIIELRKKLHQNPELSGGERETAAFIKSELNKIGGFSMFHVGGTSLLAQRTFGEEGTHLMFRCELDALPIKEINTFEYKSQNEGVSHKCGHDGHMAIMLALAQKLSDKSIQKGTVSLLFQSAEENGKGAQEIIENKTFNNIDKPDHIIAIHNVPGFPLHQVILKKDVFTPSVISVEITLKGMTSHAAEPEKGVNPAPAIADIIKETNQKQNSNQQADDFCVFTPVYMEMGEKSYGVSAGEGMIGLTIRCWKASYMKELIDWTKNLVNTTAEKYNIEVEMNWFESFSSVENHEESIKMIRESAEMLNLDILEKKEPFKWGEDFGLYTQQMKGALFGLGSGENMPALHNPDYDFPDELIDSGSEIYLKIIENTLS